MVTLKKYLSLFLFISLALSVHASAVAEVWVVNPDHSEVNFSLDYLTVSKVTGKVSGVRGIVKISGDNISGGEISLAAKTINTGNKKRDKHLISSEFFNAKSYPRIFFKMASVAGNQLKGSLLINGHEKAVGLHFDLSEALKDTWDYQVRFLKFKTSINREDFGLNWNKSLANKKFLVGRKVSIEGVLQLQPMGSITPTMKHMIPDTNYMRAKEKYDRGEVGKIELKTFEYDQIDTATKVSVHSIIPSQEKPKINEFSEQAPKSISFWAGFMALALLGFVASFALFLKGKEWIYALMPESYRETGFWGVLSDGIGVLFFTFYVVALYFVGWS